MLRPDFSNDDERLGGVYVAIVTSNEDPDNQGKIKVVFPWMNNEVESHWARVATLYAGKDRGHYFIPEVDDEVLVVFEHGDPNHPYIVASLWNGKDELPEPGHPDGKNNHKVIETRSGHKLTFDDTDGAERISLVDSSLNNSITIDVPSDNITILAKTGDIHIKAPAGSINFSSKTMTENVTETKDHTSGATHDITVSAADYTETVDAAKSLTVGAGLSRAAQQVTMTASSSMTSTGGSLKTTVNGNLAMTQTGAVTQTIGSSEVKASGTVQEHSPAKTWTVGNLTFNAKSSLGLTTPGTMTVMAGMMDMEVKGKASILGSMVMNMGGLINLTADQVSFKPGG